MRTTSLQRKLMITVFLTVMAFFLISNDCRSQDWDREGRTEIFVIGQQMDGDSTHDDFLGRDVEVDDTFVWGFGVGYNFNDHLNLNIGLWFGSTDIESGIFTADTDLTGMDFNVDYNILEGPLTPLITGGIGFIHFDGELVLLGLDFSETNFSYNVGAGFRWDIDDNFLLKALYRFTWTKLEDTDDRIMLDGISVSIGYKF